MKKTENNVEIIRVSWEKGRNIIVIYYFFPFHILWAGIRDISTFFNQVLL